MQLSSEKSAEAYAEVENKKAEVQTLQQTLRSIEAELNDLRERSKNTKKNLEESQQMCRKVEEQLEERLVVAAAAIGSHRVWSSQWQIYPRCFRCCVGMLGMLVPSIATL